MSDLQLRRQSAQPLIHHTEEAELFFFSRVLLFFPTGVLREFPLNFEFSPGVGAWSYSFLWEEAGIDTEAGVDPFLVHLNAGPGWEGSNPLRNPSETRPGSLHFLRQQVLGFGFGVCVGIRRSQGGGQ